MMEKELERWKLLTGCDTPEEAQKIIVSLEEEAFKLRKMLKFANARFTKLVNKIFEGVK
jgi:hypothetical protein